MVVIPKQVSNLENVSCDLCGSDESKLQFSAKDWHFECAGQFAIVQCTECGLSYLSPRPRALDMGEYYPSSYYTHHKDTGNRPAEHTRGVVDEGASRRSSHSFVKRCVKSVLLNEKCGRFEWLVGAAVSQLQRSKLQTRWRWGLFEERGRLLDVGCGGGNFLRTLTNDWLLEGRFDVKGIDIDEAAIASAVGLGVDAEVHDFPNTPYADTEFDIVTMRHSLEHMYSPKAAIQEVHRLLRQGGKLLIEVPNFGSWGPLIFRDRWSAADAPRHLYHFTLATLRDLLERNGFRVVDQHKWPTTFKRQLSLDNQRRYYESQPISQFTISQRMLFWGVVSAIADRCMHGGAMSMAAIRR